MMKYFKYLFITITMVCMATTLQSCDDDDDEYTWGTPQWFNGKVFTADAQPGQYNSFWVLQFNSNGTFSVIPVDRNGNEIWQMDGYEGRWNVDFYNACIYVSYYGFPTTTTWTFQWWDDVDDYTGYYPYIEIYTAPGGGMLDNLTFYPGF